MFCNSDADWDRCPLITFLKVRTKESLLYDILEASHHRQQVVVTCAATPCSEDSKEARVEFNIFINTGTIDVPAIVVQAAHFFVY